MTENYLELIDIDEIEFTDEYDNMIDIQIDIDESFCLSNGIISHNSALSTCLSGFSVTGRKYYGAFPLKGKPLNVRGEGLVKIKDNEEIKNIVSALGLVFGKKYENVDDLRYGKVVVMSDSDADGSHIKGLIINLFDTFWPELLDMDFLYEFVTPIIKVEKGKRSRYFYKLSQYKKWKTMINTNSWFIKYYKGLGTIQQEESKLFFSNLNKHLVRFNTKDVDKRNNLIDLAFNKKKSDDRKEWLLSYNPQTVIDKVDGKQTYENFINNELIEFSMVDNIRSIPSVVDGLKPSQRKILYTMIKKNIKSQIKVSSFAGSVIESTSYHHGQSSLESSIIGMAQNFIGSNNLNLLEPRGMFGTRLKGGKDSSASRYLFTQLSDMTRFIFIKEDDNILSYLDDDGYSIEPEFYVPIIPMVLVNGSDGIGTGWRSDVPKYNPFEIIDYIKNKINNKRKNILLIPNFNNFKGEILYDEDNGRYVSRGVFEKINSTKIVIRELPIGLWNDKYYDNLEKLLNNGFIKDYTKNCTDVDIDININISRENMKELMDDPYKILGLETYLNLNNMYLFDDNYKIKKFENPYEIIDYHYDIRLKFYEKRKEFILNKMDKDISVLRYKIKFIEDITNDRIIINKKTKEYILNQLKKMKYPDDSYDYLLSMSLYNLTIEKIEEYNRQLSEKILSYDNIKSTDIKDMWLNDLNSLRSHLKSK